MKRLLSLSLVLLMLMDFSACGSFTPRSDSVYIKVYNSTGCAIKRFAFNEYENFVLKSTIVAENADGGCYNPGSELIFEVLGADPDALSFVISAENGSNRKYSSKTVSAASLSRGEIYSYSVSLAGDRLVLEFMGVEE